MISKNNPYNAVGYNFINFFVGRCPHRAQPKHHICLGSEVKTLKFMSMIKMSNETSKNLVFIMNSIAVTSEGTWAKHEKVGRSECTPASRCRKRNEKERNCLPLSRKGWSNWDSKLINVGLHTECKKCGSQSKHRSSDHIMHDLSVTGNGCGSQHTT
jgi:hypothetical protein